MKNPDDCLGLESYDRICRWVADGSGIAEHLRQTESVESSRALAINTYTLNGFLSRVCPPDPSLYSVAALLVALARHPSVRSCSTLPCLSIDAA